MYLQFGMKTFYRKHDDVIRQIRRQHRLCVLELSAIENDVGIETPRAHFKTHSLGPKSKVRRWVPCAVLEWFAVYFYDLCNVAGCDIPDLWTFSYCTVCGIMTVWLWCVLSQLSVVSTIETWASTSKPTVPAMLCCLSTHTFLYDHSLQRFTRESVAMQVEYATFLLRLYQHPSMFWSFGFKHSQD